MERDRGREGEREGRRDGEREGRREGGKERPRERRKEKKKGGRELQASWLLTEDNVSLGTFCLLSSVHSFCSAIDAS